MFFAEKELPYKDDSVSDATNVKHAYLLICHNNIWQLQVLLSLLDYRFNDIYIHFDKKSEISGEEKESIVLSVKYSNIFFIKS